MGGKRTAQPSRDAHGKAAASGDVTAAQGGASQKRQTLGLTMGSGAGSAGAGSSGQEESGLTMRVVPSQDTLLDTLLRVLPLLLGRLELEWAVKCSRVCQSWRGEMEAVGFCDRTVRLCSALAESGDIHRIQQKNVQRRLDSTRAWPAADAASLDGFLEKSAGWNGSLQEWLQAALQEPDASFLSRGAASTAQILGLALVRWVGKPQGLYALTRSSNPGWVGCYPGLYTLTGHSDVVMSVAISRDGTRAASGSDDRLVKIWNLETGAEVRAALSECVEGGEVMGAVLRPSNRTGWALAGGVWSADADFIGRCTRPAIRAPADASAPWREMRNSSGTRSALWRVTPSVRFHRKGVLTTFCVVLTHGSLRRSAPSDTPARAAASAPSRAVMARPRPSPRTRTARCRGTLASCNPSLSPRPGSTSSAGRLTRSE